MRRRIAAASAAVLLALAVASLTVEQTATTGRGVNSHAKAAHGHR
jgi:hypothetical protein